MLVTVAIEIGDDEGPAISETQTIVYTDAVPAVGSDADAPVPNAEWEGEVATDTVRLFRFSALTFNGHRIHYDEAYTTGEESYRGLVVHGPLTAILLAEMARARGIAGRAFHFHGRTPPVCG
ncbi:MAG: hypothetical protein EHM57_06440 [Actinobacteria bacterium]|nr:MAG: hypothetical protein EHM57_06440 [Actinomycetota bacterium]